MKKWPFLLLGLGLLVGGLLWRWPYLRLPGEIAFYHDNGLYLFRPQGFWRAWRRVTPREMLVSWSPISWSPDGQMAAFQCSDGKVQNGYVYRPYRSNQPAERFDPATMQVRDGLCVLERSSGELRWLIDRQTTYNDIYDTIIWTFDGHYIVFESRHLGWQRLDPLSGATSAWQEEPPVQDRGHWRTEIEIPAEAFRQVNGPEHWSWTKITGPQQLIGNYSPDRRYVLLYFGGGENDAWLHYIYDSQAQRLLYLGTSHHAHSLAWLPALSRR